MNYLNNKYKISLFTAGLLILLFFGLGFSRSKDESKNNVYTLDHPTYGWKYTTQQGYQIPLPTLDRVPHYKNPVKESYCKGTYLATFDLSINSSLRSILQNDNLAIFIPAVGGFSALRINNTAISFQKSNSYFNIGPIIILPVHKIPFSRELKIEIDIEAPNQTFIGMYRGAPILGEFLQLNEIRDRNIAYFQYFPLTFSAIYLVLCLLFWWLSIRLSEEDLFCRTYSICLFSCSLFYFFLSGIPRTWSPYWGSVFYFPLNLVMTTCIFNLLSTYANVSKDEIRKFTKLYLIGTGLNLILTLKMLYFEQMILIFISKFFLFYPITLLYLRAKSNAQKLIPFIAAIVSLFYLSGSIKLIFEYTDYTYPIGYTERFTSPILILTSIIYFLHRLVKEFSNSQQRKIIAEISSQVAHDIRSPLAALDMVIEDISSLPEDQRLLFRSASNRIKDITHQLLDTQRNFRRNLRSNDSPLTLVQSEKLSTCLLSSLIESLVAEKRIESRSKMKIEIEFQLDVSSYGLFASLQPVEFKRMISNLINNSLEASPHSGKITITLSTVSNHIYLKIQDNGKGIPPEILSQIGEEGLTYDKKGGSGLGLNHAQRSVQAWGGKLQIDSVFGKGTCVTIIFPKANAPFWYVPKLEVASHARVVILDDDQSIHQIWENRFKKLNPRPASIHFYHFTKSDEVVTWHAGNIHLLDTTLYLIDYELIDSTHNGLDLIDHLKIQQKSILVTSRFEESSIVSKCEIMGVKILPKVLARIVPIHLEEK